MKKIKRIFSIVILFAFISQIGSCSLARLEMERFFHYIDDLRIELHNNKASEKKKEKLLKKARERILLIIDTEYVGKLSLGKYFGKIPEKDREEFIDIFKQILAYNIVKTHIPINKIVDQNVNIELLGEKIIHDKKFDIEATVIHTRLITKTVTYNIDFYLHPVGKKFKLYDVNVDGASVLLDYQNQFYSIIEKRGFPVLMTLLREKLKKVNEVNDTQD